MLYRVKLNEIIKVKCQHTIRVQSVILRITRHLKYISLNRHNCLPCDSGIIIPTGYEKRLRLIENKKLAQSHTVIKV